MKNLSISITICFLILFWGLDFFIYTNHVNACSTTCICKFSYKVPTTSWDGKTTVKQGSYYTGVRIDDYYKGTVTLPYDYTVDIDGHCEGAFSFLGICSECNAKMYWLPHSLNIDPATKLCAIRFQKEAFVALVADLMVKHGVNILMHPEYFKGLKECYPNHCSDYYVKITWKAGLNDCK